MLGIPDIADSDNHVVDNINCVGEPDSEAADGTEEGKGEVASPTLGGAVVDEDKGTLRIGSVPSAIVAASCSIMCAAPLAWSSVGHEGGTTPRLASGSCKEVAGGRGWTSC